MSLLKNNKKLFWFDVETTGLHPENNGITQLSYAIVINGKVIEEDTYFVKPFPDDIIDPKALQVQGKTTEEILNYEEPALIYNRLISVLHRNVDRYNKLDKLHPAGYNVRFDCDFLKAFFVKNYSKYYNSYFNWKLVDPFPFLHMLDSMDLLSLPNYKLKTVCSYFNIELDAHTASNDIIATRKLMNLLQERYLKNETK